MVRAAPQLRNQNRHAARRLRDEAHADKAVARRVNRDAATSTAWSDDPADNFYYLTDVMFSVRAVTDSTGLLHTRLDYTPYGVAMHGFAADVNGDGALTFDDLLIALANHNSGSDLKPGDTGYDPDAFLDGGDAVDMMALSARYNDYAPGGSNPTFNAGWIDNPSDPNGPDNSVGYDGYWFDLAGATEATSTGLYMVRHRVYDPKLGRWLQRDPLHYHAGMSLFEYGDTNPINRTDPSGLIPITIPWQMIPPPKPPAEGPGLVYAPGFDPDDWWYPATVNNITVIYNDPNFKIPPPPPPQPWPNCCPKNHPEGWNCTSPYNWWQQIACKDKGFIQPRTPACDGLCRSKQDPSKNRLACYSLCQCLESAPTPPPGLTGHTLVHRILMRSGGTFNVHACRSFCTDEVKP